MGLLRLRTITCWHCDFATHQLATTRTKEHSTLNITAKQFAKLRSPESRSRTAVSVLDLGLGVKVEPCLISVLAKLEEYNLPPLSKKGVAEIFSCGVATLFRESATKSPPYTSTTPPPHHHLPIFHATAGAIPPAAQPVMKILFRDFPRERRAFPRCSHCQHCEICARRDRESDLRDVCARGKARVSATFSQ